MLLQHTKHPYHELLVVELDAARGVGLCVVVADGDLHWSHPTALAVVIVRLEAGAQDVGKVAVALVLNCNGEWGKC